MKFYITGSTRGLGKFLCNEFNCINFDRPYDLSIDIDRIVELIELDSVVILNAHASGTQLKYVEKLKDKCNLVVCGSIASINFDSSMLQYSQEKNNLEKEIVQISLKNKKPILYLRLTSSSYKDHKLIAKTIRFWLDNPNFTFAGFNIDE
jgi:hypothetical protein